LFAIVPVYIDVLLPKDPTDPFGGLKSNASSLRCLNETYDIFGVFCRPNSTGQLKICSGGVWVDVFVDFVQLLVHGITYINQYWLPATEEFRNQSYTDFACDRGLPSFAIDLVGVG
jgi:hypothetical protein